MSVAIRSTAVAVVLGLVCGGAFAATSADVGPVGDKADATRYLNAVFVQSQCRISEADLLVKMRADRQSPTAEDRSQPSIGTLMLIRHRWIFSTLQDLIATGQVCQDPGDISIAISKFGGCGA